MLGSMAAYLDWAQRMWMTWRAVSGNGARGGAMEQQGMEQGMGLSHGHQVDARRAAARRTVAFRLGERILKSAGDIFSNIPVIAR